jgi:hypothetical protein
MKNTLLILICLSLTGCVASQVDKLRKKIPVGHAENLSASVTTLGGWGGTITGKNLDSEGRGRLSADEYTEQVNSPWATYKIELTGAAIGKRKIEVKSPDDKP